jgi:hypothetical protein
MMGRKKEARAADADIFRINPNFPIDSWAKHLLYKNHSQNDKVVRALRRSGLK